MQRPAKKKPALEPYAGPRILVVLDPAGEGARAVELACLLGRESHTVIHVVSRGGGDSGGMAARHTVDRAVQQARLFHMRVVIEDQVGAGSAGGILRLVRRLRPGTLILGTTRPRTGWKGIRRHVELWNILKQSPCEVLLVRT